SCKTPLHTELKRALKKSGRPGYLPPPRVKKQLVPPETERCDEPPHHSHPHSRSRSHDPRNRRRFRQLVTGAAASHEPAATLDQRHHTGAEHAYDEHRHVARKEPELRISVASL